MHTYTHTHTDGRACACVYACTECNYFECLVERGGRGGVEVARVITIFKRSRGALRL